MTSSPLRPGATLEEELDYYKKQYEQLETDLADFQASSKELEEQLERDIETAEKNERKLKEQVEKLNFEVDEWKGKCTKSKAESNAAHNKLEREVRELREGKRGLELKVRDLEVGNDEFEREKRNTESSLEDLESKYNVAIERGVLMEEELKNGEVERESLRIESQRLREELGDLKVESDITLEKLRLAQVDIERLRTRKPSPLAVESLRNRSPGSEVSRVTPESPTASTPPPKSDSASEMATPPSPPLSDAPVATTSKADPKTPMPKRRSLIPDAGATPRPRTIPPRHSRGPSVASSSAASDAHKAMRPPPRVTRPSAVREDVLPRSESLYQMKNLRSRMQKIEERVHSARSKLPATAGRKSATPKNSPLARPQLGAEDLAVPSSITMRRSIRRTGSHLGSQTSQLDLAQREASQVASDDNSPSKAVPDPSMLKRRESRLSYGIPRPSSSLSSHNERPSSSHERPGSAAASRPGSRASLAYDRPSSRASLAYDRPSSRTSGIGIPNSNASEPGVPSRSGSALGGTGYATVHGTPRSRMHRTSASVSELRRKANESDDASAGLNGMFAPPARRTTMDRSKAGGIPAAPVGGANKRMSGGLPQPKRVSGNLFGKDESEKERDRGMMPPPSRRKMSDVGETY